MIVIASILFMASVGPLVAVVMLLFDQQLGTHIYDPNHGGDPVLWQHLFWFFGHPEVYVVLLPAMGIVAEVITVFSAQEAVRLQDGAYTAIGTGIISFFVWAHHQFVAGIDPRMANVFTVTTLSSRCRSPRWCSCTSRRWYGGSIRFTTPMLWARLPAEFLIGGVTGIFLGSSGSDIYFHDTYFVVAHFHYTFFPIAFIGGFAAITYWFPKMFGRMMNDARQDSLLGNDHPVQRIFMPLFLAGLSGDHRRIYSYTNFPTRTPGLLQAADGRHRVACRAAGVPVRLPLQLHQQHLPRRESQSGTLGAKHAGVDGRFAAAARQLPPSCRLFTAGPYEYMAPGRDEDFWPQNERQRRQSRKPMQSRLPPPQRSGAHGPTGRLVDVPPKSSSSAACLVVHHAPFGDILSGATPPHQHLGRRVQHPGAGAAARRRCPGHRRERGDGRRPQPAAPLVLAA